MKQRLINHIQSIANPALRRTCEEILAIEKFFTWPASLSHHHAYEGGLLAHTVEVADLAKQIAGYHENPERCLNRLVDYDILIAAALWHDVMKSKEYVYKEGVYVTSISEKPRFLATAKGAFHPTDYQKTIGHICGGAALFNIVATEHKVPTPTIDAITHCILAHHGRREWGSPVEPQTLEAMILHHSDMLSSRYGATKEVKP